MSLHRIQDTAGGWRLFALAVVAVLLTFWAGAARAQAGDALSLDPARPAVQVQSALGRFGPQPRGGIDAASNGRIEFQDIDLRRPLRFRSGESLWLKLRLLPVPGSSESWVLEVPMPVVDTVLLYQRDASGRWFARKAGDLVPKRDWPQAGRYPFFHLQLKDDGPTEVYLEIRHSTSMSAPVRVLTGAAHYQQSQLEYLILGLVMGALALLVLASILRALLLRDGAYVWYAIYATIAMLALAAFTGVAAHLLWGNSPLWVDAAPGCLALVGGSLALLIVTRLGGTVTRVRWLARALLLAGGFGVLLAILYALLERSAGIVLLSAHIAAVAGLSMYAATLTWRRGDPVGVWMLLGAVPLTLAVFVALARAFGLAHSTALTEYALVVALTINLPMLFGALNSRSHERRSVELRRVASSSQDPLTGLLRSEPFVARLRQALTRYERRGEGAAVAVIDVVNHEWIHKTRGAEAAEEALLRTVIKLRRLVRDVDTTGRLGEARFGLILEGVGMRRPMNTVAARLIAAGLMEEPDSPRDTVLHFHIAAVVLTEHSAPAEQLLASLGTVLDGMSPRTRRPVRFLEPGGAEAGGMTQPGPATEEARPEAVTAIA